MKKITALLAAATFTATAVSPALACTGISLSAEDGTRIQASFLCWQTLLNLKFRILLARGVAELNGKSKQVT